LIAVIFGAQTPAKGLGLVSMAFSAMEVEVDFEKENYSRELGFRSSVKTSKGARFLSTDLFHLRVKAPTSASVSAEISEILTPAALLFLEELEAKFGNRRRELLSLRSDRRERLQRGVETLDFLPETASVRSADWQVAPTANDLNDRSVEITGPVESKMMINALNSGAKVFMADLEDATSPTWENAMGGQWNLKQVVRRKLTFSSVDGRDYNLKAAGLATLVVRPRGWHLNEKHILFDGHPMSGSLVDFGLYFFHNAKELIERGSGPYFYLPKIESHLEARLWNEVFNFAQDRLAIPRGTIRATVLIETILAAFEMDEILFELKDHAAGLNAGRWDYLFSMIKTFSGSKDVIFPDRVQLTMTVPFMRSYTKLLVATCHRRAAHAIGGMAAFIPSRKDPEANSRAIAKVREDKEREAGDGFDGTWVAHPDLVPIAQVVFSKALGERAHQKDNLAVQGRLIAAKDLLPSPIEGGRVTEEGVSGNISVALQYISSWLQGFGAVAINNLMEDAATAEIARAELWQWVKFEVRLAEGTRLTRDEFRRRLESERARFAGQAERGRLNEACALLERLVLSEEFTEFLTLPAYEILEK
jgi:malate synthase